MTPHAIIHSKVESLENLWIAQVPVKPVNVTRAVRTGNTVVLLGEKGQIYATGIQTGISYSDGQASTKLQDTIAGLSKLGHITPQAAEQHRALNERLKLQREQRWAANSLTDAAHRLGIKLTAAQWRKLDALTASEGQQ